MASEPLEKASTPRAFRKQHLVSAVLLRRFSNTNGRVAVYNKATELVTSEVPEDVCWFEFFVHSNPKDAEEHWAKYERRLPHLFEVLDAGELFQDERAMTTARTTLALHAARSFSMRELAKNAHDGAKLRTSRELVRDHPGELAKRIQSDSPFNIPVTRSLLQDKAENLVERLGVDLEPGGENFRQNLIKYFREARRILRNQQGLEVLIPSSRSAGFVIGDDPVLLPSALKDGRVGLLQGVGLLSAATFVMPFGPRVSIAVGPSNTFTELDDALVDWNNRMQVEQAHSHVIANSEDQLINAAQETLVITEQRR